MDTPHLKESDYLKAWGLYFLCVVIGGGMAGVVIGGFLGVILANAGVSLENIKIAGGVAGFIVSAPVSYFLFRFFVSRFLVQKLMQRQNSREASNVA